MGFWTDLLGRKTPVPTAAMSPNVTWVGAGDSLADALNISGLSVAQLWRTQPHLRTVVSFRARNVAHLGLHVFSRAGDDRKRDRTSALAMTLRRPNASMTMYEMVYALVGDIDLYDRAFWLATPDAEARSGWSIHRLPPAWVKAGKRDTFAVHTWEVSAPDSDKTVTVPADQVLAFTGYNPTSPLVGSPTVESLRQTLQEQVEAARYRAQVWKRGGRVSAVLQRPKDAPQWSDAAREAFREDWYAKYTGNGPKSGGTPILEDGMTLQRIDFNAQEQQFVEAAKLALSTVASAYHVNPTMVGVLDNANYSNVREFRRMLYGDSLGPTLAQIEDRINTFLIPMIMGDAADDYFVEFNIGEKLQGSFEEQAQVMQTLVGAPLMTRDEGRAKFNLPAMGGAAAELITPLNVLVGGQASPTDSGSQNIGSAAGPHRAKALTAGIKSVTDEQRSEIADVLAAFFQRQGKSVLSALGAGAEEWWDSDRWNGELAADLHAVTQRLADTLGPAEARRLGYPDDYDTEQTVEFLRAVAERRARAINDTTKAQLDEAITDPDGDPATVFTEAETTRAAGVAVVVATGVAGFAAREAGEQIAIRNDVQPVKTWVVNSSNPRAEHRALSGETVAIDQPFSNGMQFPGDYGAADQVAGCQCSVLISIP